MRTLPILILTLALGAAIVPARAASAPAPLFITGLRCEYKTNPLGIDERQPRLSWIVDSSLRGQRQSAYQVLAAASEIALTSGTGDLWDSGKVVADDSIAVVWGGKPLTSHQPVYWKVRVWDASGNPSGWSTASLFSMGLLEPGDWTAQWIGYDKARQDVGEVAREDNKPKKEDNPKAILPPAPYLRTAFKVDKPLRRATLYASALGIVDLHLNGLPVSSERFAPGWTDYAKRVYYKTYNVTPIVRRGDNALGAVLADGWYSGYLGWFHQRNHYGTKPRVRAQLHLEFEDGSTKDVVSGPDWKAAYGAIREADFLMGETYDARQILVGWAAPGCDDSKWEPVVTGAEVNPVMQAYPSVPVMPFEEIQPVAVTEPKPGVWVLDMGQNFAGVVRLNVSGKAGQQIVLRYAERLNPDGTIYTTNLRGARVTDTYTCAGGGAETWQPRFTFHGFQYVEVSGLGAKPEADTIVGVALSSATPPAGTFECSDPMLNRLYKNIVYTQRANYIDIPTDCPQRDERLGWTGDAQVYVRTATLNADVQAFYAKWLVDLEDAQGADGEFPKVAPVKVAFEGGGPAWADAGVICPWMIYEVYGDTRVLERHYESMKKFIAFTEGRCKPGPLPPDKFHCFGDWLSIGADTPKDVIFLAYFACSTRLVARAAQVLGKDEDAKKYNDLYARIRESFQKAYVAPDGRIKGDTQAVYVLALANDLLTPEQAAKAAQYLVEGVKAKNWHLSTGFIGTKDLMLVLSKIGRLDVAYRLLHNDTFPSWGFSIKQGATSIWERWDGWTPDKGFQDAGMNSFAHYSFGAVYGWMAENIGGIRSEGPAFKRLYIAPRPGGKLTWARTSYKSIHGLVATDWRRQGDKFTLNVTIPANTTATIILPTRDAAAVSESGKPLGQAEGLKLMGSRPGAKESESDSGPRPVVIQAGSGRYAFTITGPIQFEAPAGTEKK